MSAASLTVAPPRFWEVDALRGIAIVAMIFFHFMWDLTYFGIYQGNILSVPWQMFAHGIATTFLLVMGVSLTLSYRRTRQKQKTNRVFARFFWRGAKILGLGMIVTLATYFALGDQFVVFGILHLLGLSIMLAYPFLSNRWVSLIAGMAMILAGLYVDRLISPWPWLLWLGVKQAGRAMADYYPVLPWSGIPLLGIFAGYTLYPQLSPRFILPDVSHIPVVRGLIFLGRHSLLIYLVHQPIVLLLLLVTGVAHLS